MTNAKYTQYRCKFEISISACILICPVELSSIVNAVAAVGFMSESAIESYLFGIIADNGGYVWSILMMIVILFIGLIISAIVHFIDIADNGPLHKTKINFCRKTK